MFRNGAIEAVDTRLLSGSPDAKNFIPSVAYERDLIKATSDYLKIYRELEIQPPFVIMLSFLGVKGFWMYTSAGQSPAGTGQIDRDTLLIPEVVIEDFPKTPASLMRSIFDLVWQSCGYVRSFNYDANNEWVGR